MYSPKVVAKKIASLSAHTGWIPIRHTIAEVQAFSDHIDSLTEVREDGTYLTRELDADELKWIENEYNLCACDFLYWATRYAYIDVRGTIMRFNPRKSQLLLISLWGGQEERKFAIQQIILKARQQGISTLVEMAITHRLVFGRNVKAAVSSSKDEQSDLMNQMMQVALEHLPYWMKPKLTTSRTGKAYRWAGTGCRLNIYTGKSVVGIARGDSPTAIHLSEVADFHNPRELIENSLFQAVHPSPKVFMVLESTGNSNVGWWAETWYYARDNASARLQPVFLPWFLADDIFPTVSDEAEHPIPKNFTPIPETERMAAKCAAYVHNTPLMRDSLGANWTLPLRQQWFWQRKFLEARAKGNEKGWYQEMPVDDVEALQPKKDMVFDPIAMEEQFQNRERAFRAWAITGEQVLEKHHPSPSDIDYENARFRISYHGMAQTVNGRNQREFIWEFIPLHPISDDARHMADADGKLLVFIPPEPGYDYSIGIDTAAGASGDNTAICVMRRAQTGLDQDVQVAEFTSSKVSSAEVHPFVMAIAAWYSYYMKDSAVSEPLVAIEQIQGGSGDTGQSQMKMMGYRRFYKFSRMDGKNPKKDQKKAKREGWYTSSWSRPFMLDQFKLAIENGWYKLNSPFLLKHEISAYQVDQTAGGKTRYDHDQGKHDDRIFAAAIAYIIVNGLESMTDRVKTRFVPEPQRMPAVDMTIPLGYTSSSFEIAGEFRWQ